MSDLFDIQFDLEEDTQKDKYLTFIIGNECYGIEIRFVTEIVGLQAITQIPEQKDYIKGIINLRGKIIPVIDVRTRFRKEPKEYNDRTCVIVVEIKELLIGLIVDCVAEVLTIPEKDIVDPPQVNRDSNNRYIKKIGKVQNSVKLLLDCERLLSDNELDNLSEVI